MAVEQRPHVVVEVQARECRELGQRPVGVGRDLKAILRLRGVTHLAEYTGDERAQAVPVLLLVPKVEC